MRIQLLADRGGGVGGTREREEVAQKQRDERQREEGIKEETTHSAEEGVAEEKKHPRTDRSDTEMDSIAIQAQEGAHDNIYLTGSDKEAIVDFVEDHEELYDNINEHFKDKASVRYSFIEIWLK